MGLGCDQVVTLPNCEAYHFPFHTRMLSTKQCTCLSFHNFQTKKAKRLLNLE
jgi:hypothetical protein